MGGAGTGAALFCIFGGADMPEQHSPDVIKAVVAAYDGDKSASQVAHELGLPSRNVVVGIWYRARMKGRRVTGHKLVKQALIDEKRLRVERLRKEARRKAEERRLKAVQAKVEARLRVLAEKDQAPRVERQRRKSRHSVLTGGMVELVPVADRVKPMDMVQVDRAMEQPVAGCKPIPLLKAEARQCRWVVSSRPAMICAAPTGRHSSWCEEHRLRVYTQRPEILARADRELRAVQKRETADASR